MAPGRNRRPKGSRRGFKRKMTKFAGHLTKKQKRHLKEYGDIHPSENKDADSTKYRRVYDANEPKSRPDETKIEASSGSESEDEFQVENPLNDLISTFDNENIESLDDSDSTEEENYNEVTETERGEEESTRTEADEDCQKRNHEVKDDTFAQENEAEDEMSENDQVTEEHRDGDLFCRHFETILEESVVAALGEKENWETKEVKLPVLGLVACSRFKFSKGHSFQNRNATMDLEKLGIKPQLHVGWQTYNKQFLGESSTTETFTQLQRDILPVVNSYADLVFYGRNHENGEEVRALYCLHVLNHALKTRARVVHHNSKLSRRDDVPEDFRDQGLTRPKVLILIPFREAALRVVRVLTTLLSPDDRANVVNKKRFHDEFGDSTTTKRTVRRFPKPPDHEAMFAGHADDNFRIGIAITKKSLRLYADFYVADIILASPLGLRILIGTDGEKDRDYDFLSSIEIVIVDQADVMLMQNWEHTLHCFNHLHLQPLDSHGADFSRIRLWTLNGWSKHYRQTLCFTSFISPEVNALFNRFCCNYDGVVRTINPIIGGSIRQVAVQLPQVFQRFQPSSLKEDPDARFQFFTSKILPQYTEAVMARTLIYVSSYFDFVRLRNHFRKEDLSFVQICEYQESGKVAQARDRFCHRERKFLLYTERAHFYQRYRIKGIRHVVFYQLPLFPHFYSELCNLMGLLTKQGATRMANDQNLTCTIMYSRYDGYRLAAVVGTERAAQMLSSNKDVHLFVTGDS